MLAGILLLLTPSVGIYEARRGTWRAITLFLVVHIVTLLLTTALVVWPLHLAGARLQADWAPSGDVGASFGEFGCLGARLTRLPFRGRSLWIPIVLLLLALKLVLIPERFGDVGHMIAFVVGMGLDRLLFGA